MAALDNVGDDGVDARINGIYKLLYYVSTSA